MQETIIRFYVNKWNSFFFNLKELLNFSMVLSYSYLAAAAGKVEKDFVYQIVAS